MKKLIISIIVMFTSVLFLLPALSNAAIQVGTGIYPPLWSPAWVAEGTTGMWQGFYISKSDNIIKYDIVEVGGGNWKTPIDDAAVIWEGNTNVIIPSGKTDVGYTFNALESGKIEFTMAFKLENRDATNVEFAVYKNDFNDRIYPKDDNSIVAKYNIPQNINFIVDLAKGEKILFRFNSAAKVAVNNQIRFTAMQAVYKSLGSSTVSGVNSTASATTGIPGKIVPITSKFDDVRINSESSIITLSKRLTVDELFTSFMMNDGNTIEILLSDGNVADDMEQIVVDGMKIRVYKLRSEIVAEFNVIAPKIKIIDENENAWIYYAILISLVVLILIFLISIKLIKRKNIYI